MMIPIPRSLFPFIKSKRQEVKVMGDVFYFNLLPSAFLHWILVNNATILVLKPSTAKNLLEAENLC